jgi:hypothetical protein
MQRFAVWVFVSTSLAFVSGCVQMHPTRTGFLSSYDQLRANKRDRIRLKPVYSQELATIDSFYIEPVEWMADDLGQPASSEKNRETIQAEFQKALDKEFAKIRPVVCEIGPQTAVVRAAITGVREADPWANILLIGQLAGPILNGGASVEIEVLTPEGHQIAAESAGFCGHDWDLFGFFWRPAHAKSATRQGARRLAKEISSASHSD